MRDISAKTAIDRRSALKGFVTIAGMAVVLPAMGSLAGCSSSKLTGTGKTELIDAITNLIIPQTDSPGARIAGVPAYIEAVFADHFTADQQKDFLDGLAVFDKTAAANGAPVFTAAREDIQNAVLSQLDEARDPAWQWLRDMTVFGFYTSEAATEELAFEEIPGRYDGCIKFAEVGRAWLDRGV